MIDIHSHFFPPLSRNDAAAMGTDVWLRDDGEEGGHIMRGDSCFRPVKRSLWDPEDRINALADHRIEQQILCATPILFGYGESAETALTVAVFCNDAARTHCATDPTRLFSLCQVPLQSLQLACDELDRALNTGHCGVQIGNHVGARDLDDGELIEFLQHCAHRNASVLVHPWDMFAPERMNRYMLQWLVAMPAETQLSILYLILSGAFERLPTSLRICFAHGGGSFAYLLGRVENAWHERDIVRADCPHPPSTYCERFFTDSVVFSEPALRLLREVMSVDNIMFGTDFPFPLGDPTPGELINGFNEITTEEKQQLLGGNARDFFGIESHDLQTVKAKVRS